MTRKISESALWNRIKKNNPDPNYFHFERLENLAGIGIPDVVFKLKVHDSYTIWIELKTAIAPKNINSKIFKKGYFRPSQIEWHKKWNGLYAKVYILIGIGNELALIPTKGIEDEINDLTLKDFKICRLGNSLYSELELISF